MFFISIQILGDYAQVCFAIFKFEAQVTLNKSLYWHAKILKLLRKTQSLWHHIFAKY